MKTVFYCLTLLFFFFAAGTANAQEPTCTLTAVPNSVASGESSVLTWTIQNASNASIAPNIGSVSHLINGSQEVTPTETTNYTMTVGGRVLTQPGTCTARVTVTNSTTPVEEPFTPSRFIPCEGKGCSACNLVEMGNELIVWLFGMIFLLFAVLMTVAGFGLVTSGGNPSAMQAAKDKFTNAMIGLVIVMSAWLIVDTVMKALVGGGETDAAIGTMKGWGPWSEVQCQTQTPVTSPPPSTGGGGVTPVNPGACPIAPLSPSPTDPVSIRLENGETTIWENTDPQLKICAEKKGGTINSAFRPEAYQRHIYEVWDKWCNQGLKDNTASACSVVKSKVYEEMKHHQLLCTLLVARSASTHGRGIGVDISGAPQNNEHCLTWFGAGDRVHYTLRPGCVCN